ncbi:TetR/AcrR family transcriptional regulator (plasmid) [Rhizobium sp. NIBRBAC000502774]|nr:TetR/AcrR family transcriptional regulator [Rhizobium sp. NIBRBAC000502774]
MGRRSDHTRSEIAQMLISEGHKHLAEVGLTRFSAREVAKRIGYSIGTLYNVFGTYDHFLWAVNTRTFEQWAHELDIALSDCKGDRIQCLVENYFSFARTNTNLWRAIYEHHVPDDFAMPDEQHAERGKLTELVVQEVADALPGTKKEMAPRLARSLIATVHGHCTFDLSGSFSLMGLDGSVEMALERVRESIRVTDEGAQRRLVEETT